MKKRKTLFLHQWRKIQSFIYGDMHRARGPLRFSVTWIRKSEQKIASPSVCVSGKQSFHKRRLSHILYLQPFSYSVIIVLTWQYQRSLATKFSLGKVSRVFRRAHGPVGPPGGSCAAASLETSLQKKRNGRWFFCNCCIVAYFVT